MIGIAAGDRTGSKQRHRDTLTYPQALHLVTDALDNAGDLGAGDGRQVRRDCVAVLSHQGLGKVDADGANADQDLTAVGGWRRLLDEIKDIRTAKAAELNLSHASSRDWDLSREL